jgi:hypothetical protein
MLISNQYLFIIKTGTINSIFTNYYLVFLPIIIIISGILPCIFFNIRDHLNKNETSP